MGTIMWKDSLIFHIRVKEMEKAMNAKKMV